MLNAHLHRDPASLEGLEAAWRSLPCPTPFGSWAFAHHWLQTHPDDTEPFVISVHDGDRLVALAPWSLVHRRERLGKRHVTGFGGGDGWYHDPLQAAADPAIGTAIARCLRANRAQWDTLRLRLRTGSQSLIEELRRVGPAIAQSGDEGHHRLIDLSSGYEAYWQGLPSALRRNLRAAERKLQGFAHRYREVDAGNAERWLNDLFRLHQDRWTAERDQEAFYAMNTPEGWQAFYAFLRILASQALQAGSPCLYALEIDGRPAAIDLVLTHGACAYGTLRAYDPEFSPLSAGHLLNQWEFRRLHERGIRTIDLGSGHFAYKERLKNAVQETVHVEVATGLLGQLHAAWYGQLKPWLESQPSWQRLKARVQPPLVASAN